MKELDPVQTAGGLVPEERNGELHVWLVVCPEDVADPRANDSDWLEHEAHLQIPKGHPEQCELLCVEDDGTKVYDLEATGPREVGEETGLPVELLSWIATYRRMANEYDSSHNVIGEVEKEITVFRMRRLEGPPAPPRESHVKPVCVPVNDQLWGRMVYPQDSELIAMHWGLELPVSPVGDSADISASEAEI